MGLAASVPLLLQERGASYSQQAVFSLVSWPFSLKLLWAPLVRGKRTACSPRILLRDVDIWTHTNRWTAATRGALAGDGPGCCRPR